MLLLSFISKYEKKVTSLFTLSHQNILYVYKNKFALFNIYEVIDVILIHFAVTNYCFHI